VTKTYDAHGLNVIHQRDREPIVGTVKYVARPRDAVALVRSGDLSETVVLSIGGAVTFVGTVLMKRPAALLTVEGAPESHLGILAREFDVPAIMSIELEEAPVPKFDGQGLLSQKYQELVIDVLDGKKVSLDISHESAGFISINV
jgi:hypothetical protein